MQASDNTKIQGCALAVPEGLRLLTFAFRQLEKRAFRKKLKVLGTPAFIARSLWAPCDSSKSTALNVTLPVVT